MGLVPPESITAPQFMGRIRAGRRDPPRLVGAGRPAPRRSGLNQPLFVSDPLLVVVHWRHDPPSCFGVWVRGPASVGPQRLNGSPQPRAVNLATAVAKQVGELAGLQRAVAELLDDIDGSAQAPCGTVAGAE